MKRHPGVRRDPDPGGRLDSRVRGNDHDAASAVFSLGSHFKGREAFLTALHQKLTATPGAAAAIVARQAIHGLGGVGKTRLAVAAAQHVLRKTGREALTESASWLVLRRARRFELPVH